MQTRTKWIAILVGLATAFATVCGGWKSYNEAQAARALAQNEPKAKLAYEATVKQIEELQREQRKMHDEQLRLAAYIEGYLKATGAETISKGRLSLPEPPPDPKPVAGKKNFPENRIVLQPVPKPKAPVQSEPLSPADIGLDK